MSELASMRAIVHGHVQGVFFRAFVLEKANELGLKGFVRNLSSGTDVETHAEGPKTSLEKLIDYLKIGPPAARVENVTLHWLKTTGKYSGFTIIN